MTRRDPGSVMLTGVNIVQLDYLSHIKGLSVLSLFSVGYMLDTGDDNVAHDGDLDAEYI